MRPGQKIACTFPRSSAHAHNLWDEGRSHEKQILYRAPRLPHHSKMLLLQNPYAQTQMRPLQSHLTTRQKLNRPNRDDRTVLFEMQLTIPYSSQAGEPPGVLFRE